MRGLRAEAAPAGAGLMLGLSQALVIDAGSEEDGRMGSAGAELGVVRRDGLCASSSSEPLTSVPHGEDMCESDESPSCCLPGKAQTGVRRVPVLSPPLGSDRTATRVHQCAVSRHKSASVSEGAGMYNKAAQHSKCLQPHAACLQTIASAANATHDFPKKPNCRHALHSPQWPQAR